MIKDIKDTTWNVRGINHIVQELILRLLNRKTNTAIITQATN